VVLKTDFMLKYLLDAVLPNYATPILLNAVDFVILRLI